MRLGPTPGPPLGEALRAALGSPAVIRRLPSSPRSRVWLVEFGRSPAIVKQITGGSEADAGARFAREVAALRLARRVRPAVVPDVLGTDPGGRVMVLEYLAETSRAPAPDWMIEYATALARLHSATGPDDVGVLPAWIGPGRADARAFISLAERLGVPVPASLTASLDCMVERLNAAGHHALLHGDPCPDNAMRTDSGIMLGAPTLAPT
jgi:fructosamine-3-kinase